MDDREERERLSGPRALDELLELVRRGLPESYRAELVDGGHVEVRLDDEALAWLAPFTLFGEVHATVPGVFGDSWAASLRALAEKTAARAARLRELADALDARQDAREEV